MPIGEFELIEKYFSRLGTRRPDVVLGVGDDAAILAMPAGKRLVAATDTLVERIHFPAGSSPRSVGHRALAVNLSDLAAMGAQPAWAMLALTLPAPDADWLREFAAGFDALAQRSDVSLVGGDTTSGPLTITVAILGFCDSAYLARSGAAPGDHLFVSGTVGDAAAGLAILESRLSGGSAESRTLLQQRFEFPEARVELGGRLVGIASAAIDVSDGLTADAEKLARASGCGARIDVAELPVSAALLDCAGPDLAREFAVAGGDDYEICFAVPPQRLSLLADRVPSERWPYRCIGVLNESGRFEYHAAGTSYTPARKGFDHFAP